ncbi:MAG: ATP-binding cassette domain-containing protein [Armatimonadetes bacterium]|nr:ATP-binding cassette domain-containing protein [Armatimonadota bacterium]NIM24558.1 ATP-binding cassette domain-containing protein [Armatimonadota bacterium]NIM68434.1 ATP-binding cassette domain-containing protein [Armatimonadota bacterium]NIM76820.1 ATP-binding cassette domain-containing protein [Armatimonadota bacterium]NIN06631.1 ATP-binding cassette domain-containing protein [Armatimonadota bacterium]
MERTLLEVKNLQTHFSTYRGTLRAVDGVSLTVRRGETLALVGESGCGKSVTGLSIMRLVRRPGRIIQGEISFDKEDLLKKPRAEMRQIRGGRIAMVFQDPLSTLNPAFTVQNQISESLKIHGVASGREAKERSIQLLEAMGIPAARERLRNYPHELSGGMRQRVMIAIAASCEPELLIADEPTTALDVTLQAQIMDLLAQIKKERGLAIILITHDLGIVSQFSDRAAVMYAGHIVEQGAVESLLEEPLHPYTRGLLQCVPRLGRPDLPITPIEGSVPDMAALPTGCRFAPRCPHVMEHCWQSMPLTYEPAPGRSVRCFLYGEAGDSVRGVDTT